MTEIFWLMSAGCHEAFSNFKPKTQNHYVGYLWMTIRDLLKEDTVPRPSPPPFASANDDGISSILQKALPKIQVIGIGGAGNNAIDRLVEVGIAGAQTVAMNTDAQHLLNVTSNKKLLLGHTGRGAGNDPRMGEVSAKESAEDIKRVVNGDMVFVVCGLGGGTGTGAAPITAKLAKDQGALTVGICTLPFRMEGKIRRENAASGLEAFYKAVDTLVVIPNERLLELSEDLSMLTAFKIADEILLRAVKSITELVTRPQRVNVDFADVSKVLQNAGLALIGVGESQSSENRVEEAVEEALQNPLLDDIDIGTATKALVSVSGGIEFKLRDVEHSMRMITERIAPGAEVIWGAGVDADLGDSIRVIALLSNVHSPFTNGKFADPYDYNAAIDLGLKKFA